MDTSPFRIAIALVHFYDKTTFFSKLTELDEVCQQFPVTFYIYDAPHAVSERLLPGELQRWKTPMRVVSGDSTSWATAYNALFRAITADHLWTLILEGSVLRKGWWSHLIPFLSNPTVGLWGGRVRVGKASLSTHDHFWGENNRRPTLLELGKRPVVWVDLRFWLVKTAVCKQLSGFEERYFIGTMHIRDFSWRVRYLGLNLGLISKTIIKPWKETAYPPQRSLALYYGVRNQGLFARLRLGWWRGMLVLLNRIVIEGIWQRRLWIAAYRDGLRDGLVLFFKRTMSPTSTS